MSANYTPLGASKPWLRNEGSAVATQPSTSTSNVTGLPPPLPGQQIGVQGEVLAQITPLVTGACTKCGYVGHLPFQCRNFIQIKPNQKADIDVSSTSSEEYTTHMKEEKKRLKKEKKHEKKEMKKLEKRLKKKLMKKRSKRRRHTSSSSSSAAFIVSLKTSKSEKKKHKAKGKKDENEKRKKKRSRSTGRKHRHSTSSSD